MIISMKTKCLIIFSIFLISSFCQGADFVEEMEAITKLEQDGKWDEALNRYNNLSEELKLYLDGHSVFILHRKAICERQCRKYDASEKTLEMIVDDVDPNRDYGMQRDIIIMAMFDIAEVRARSGKLDLAHKSLESAIRFYEVNSKIGDCKGLLEWKDAKIILITKLINSAKERDRQFKLDDQLSAPKK